MYSGLKRCRVTKEALLMQGFFCIFYNGVKPMSLMDEVRTMGDNRSLKEKRQDWLQEKINGFIIERTSAIKEVAQNNQKYVKVEPGCDLEADTYCITKNLF